MTIDLIKNVDKKILNDFDCGCEELNVFLKCYARQNDKNRMGKTFVLFEGSVAAGFVTLCSGSIDYDELPKNYKLPRYPIPAIRIARLGVDKRFQGKGYGKELLSFSLEKIALLSGFIGVKFVIVDAKDSAKSFYEHYGFMPLPTSPNALLLPIETVLAAFDNK